jgi:hypothetical protein
MSLDTEKLHKLRGKKFDDLYTKQPAKWKEMVEKARDYADTYIGDGEKLRIGDVVAVVQNAIKIDPEFEKHLQSRGLIQKYWVLYFAEYIIDQVYPQQDLTAN